MGTPDRRAEGGHPPAAAPEARHGEIVRARRRARRLSVRALAAATRCSPSFNSQVENWLASPSVASPGRVAGGVLPQEPPQEPPQETRRAPGPPPPGG